MKNTKEKTNTTSTMLRHLNDLLKICSHPTLVDDRDDVVVPSSAYYDITSSCKLVALKELLLSCGIGTKSGSSISTSDDTALEATHRVLIFAQRRRTLDLIERQLLKRSEHLSNVAHLRMDGQTSKRDRDNVLRRFREDPSVDVLLLTTKVGGLGLSLTTADTVVFVEHDWNPQVDLQAMDRAHRLGQNRAVTVYRLVTESTIEQRLMSAQRFKLAMTSAVVKESESTLEKIGGMSEADLLALWRSEMNVDDEEEEKQQLDNHHRAALDLDIELTDDEDAEDNELVSAFLSEI